MEALQSISQNLFVKLWNEGSFKVKLTDVDRGNFEIVLNESPPAFHQTARYKSMEKAYKGAQDEIESLKEKLARRVQRVDDMFLAHQKVPTKNLLFNIHLFIHT